MFHDLITTPPKKNKTNIKRTKTKNAHNKINRNTALLPGGVEDLNCVYTFNIQSAIGFLVNSGTHGVNIGRFNRNWPTFEQCVHKPVRQKPAGFSRTGMMENQHPNGTCSQWLGAMTSDFYWWWWGAVPLSKYNSSVEETAVLLSHN